MTSQKEGSGAYTAEFGAVSHSSSRGFLFTVDPPTLAQEVAEALNAAARAQELQRIFDLQWKADQRAIKLWQAAHPGNDLVWPDRCNMVVWLLDHLDAAAQRARDATLPAHFRWGDDAMEQFNFGKERAALAVLSPSGAPADVG